MFLWCKVKCNKLQIKDISRYNYYATRHKIPALAENSVYKNIAINEYIGLFAPPTASAGGGVCR